MATQAATLVMPQQTSKSENADKDPKLDRYEAADNAYNSRYKNLRRSYAIVRKIAKKSKVPEAPIALQRLPHQDVLDIRLYEKVPFLHIPVPRIEVLHVGLGMENRLCQTQAPGLLLQPRDDEASDPARRWGWSTAIRPIWASPFGSVSRRPVPTGSAPSRARAWTASASASSISSSMGTPCSWTKTRMRMALAASISEAVSTSLTVTASKAACG